ncbi:hypothetical protein [uncultured Cohaesibacter sp.]|uniref:beta strand repeat-containing protein n=1 Tax=uncultured Cohaesibacter sp. TaxID=1002546 RepID=UPI002AAA74F8|nr:hypothetical protein [uncultured Cohaesibacter sp.]
MTKIRLALLAAVASGVIGGGYAFAAGGNDAAIRQNGDGNVASINQSAGTDNQFNNTGPSDASAAFQDGNNNSITAVQSGSSNAVGLTGNQFNTIEAVTGKIGHTSVNRPGWGVPAQNYDADATTGVAQIGDDNSLDVTQEIGGNIVGGVVQFSSSARSVAGQKNELEINQLGGSGNRINQVLQAVAQGSQNTATITQDGSGNVINAVNQIGLNVSGSNSDVNSITATIIGDSNGTAALSRKASASGAATSELNQMGEDNSITLNIDGSLNAFGVTQNNYGGGRNTLSALKITGDSNQLGVLQDANKASGNHNTLTISEIDGNNNNIGVKQIGNNSGTIDLQSASNSNLIGLSQTGTNSATITITSGDSNDFDALQEDYNQLTITANGSSNILKTMQTASVSGTDNELTVDILGSSNNTTGFSTANAADAIGLAAGELVQTGYGNEATITVGDSLASTNSNNNSFALSQLGNLNEATISISGGDSNQVAVLQSGNSNNSVVTQTGSSNVVGIAQ